MNLNVAIANDIAASIEPAAAARSDDAKHNVICQTGDIFYLTNFEISAMQRSFCSGLPIVMRSHSGSP